MGLIKVLNDPAALPSYRAKIIKRDLQALLALLASERNSLGVKVKDRMGRKGHKQEALAEALNCSVSALSRICSGVHSPRGTLTARLADYLNGKLPGFD